MKILIILGSTREGRVGDRVAKWVVDQSKKIEGVEVEFIDLRDWILPYYNQPKHPSMLEGNCPGEDHVEEWIAKVKEADGYLIITPEYNHSFPAVLKTALDYPYKEWQRKAVGYVSYGGLAGGSRAVEQLRLIAVELHMASVREAVIIPNIWDLVSEKEFKNDEKFDKMMGGVFEQLLWWAEALKIAREKDQP